MISPKIFTKEEFFSSHNSGRSAAPGLTWKNLGWTQEDLRFFFLSTCIPGVIFHEALMNSRISGNSSLLARSVIIWEKYERCFTLPAINLQSKWLLPLKACHNTRALLSPLVEGWIHMQGRGKGPIMCAAPASKQESWGAQTEHRTPRRGNVADSGVEEENWASHKTVCS